MGTLLGCVEADSSLAESLSGIASEEVNGQSQAVMQPYFEGDGAHADEIMLEPEEVSPMD